MRFRAAQPHPPQGQFRFLQQCCAARELWWTRASARSEGIAQWVHEPLDPEGLNLKNLWPSY